METIIAVPLLVIMFYVMAIFYALRKGFDEVITGLTSLDERLMKLNQRTQ